MLGPKGKRFDEDDAEAHEFEEYPEFPVSNINMKDYIISFLRESSNNNVNDFRSLSDHLGAEETVILRQALKQ